MDLASLANQFRLCRLQVSVVLAKPLELQGFCGDMLHNNFGRVLKLVDPALAEYAYNTNGQVKLFTLVPSDYQRRHFAQGERFSFELSLYHHLCEALPKVLEALKLWQSVGFIPDKSGGQGCSFYLEQVITSAPLMPDQLIADKDSVWGMAKPYLLADALDAVYQNLGEILTVKQRIASRIALNTPLRLTVENQLLQQTPMPEPWFNAIARRLWLLATAAGIVSDELPNRDRFFNSLPSSDGIRLIKAEITPAKLHRYASKQRQRLTLDGLMGEFYYGDLAVHHIALLEIGKHIKIGNKSTFGFGDYHWQLILLDMA